MTMLVLSLAIALFTLLAAKRLGDQNARADADSEKLSAQLQHQTGRSFSKGNGLWAQRPAGVANPPPPLPTSF